MTPPHADQLIDGYLARLSTAAADLPKGPRAELIDDMRAHIAEARARETEPETDATILNILDRLGEPAVVVADARERLGLRAVDSVRPGALEVFAVILLPFLWPIGVILLWMSTAWNVRDKIIGTLLVPGGYPVVLTLGSAMYITSGCGASSGPSGVVQESCSMAPPWLSIALFLLRVVLTIVPLAVAIYLAVRLRRGRRTVATLAA